MKQTRSGGVSPVGATTPRCSWCGREHLGIFVLDAPRGAPETRLGYCCLGAALAMAEIMASEAAQAASERGSGANS